MKRTLIALSMLALFESGLRTAEASAEVSVDFFYNNLNDGAWVDVADYGYCWQPNVATTDTSWRPYSDGYWAYTDVGWTWVSYEDFGWATYHYGRWARLSDFGWVWVPGERPVWGPAWVSWRTGGDYVGWAPLPPGGEPIYEGRSITGRVDLEFDLGPAYYNFVDVRYIGEPVLRERIFDPSQNVNYINRTVNITNITYNNGAVYNYGPDYNTLNAYSTRPIQRLTLQRETNADLTAAARSGGLTKVTGDRLIVAAPQTVQKSTIQAAPPAVKTKIDKPKFERGWSGVGDAKAQAELKQRMKTEDAKNVAAPTVKSRTGTTTAANLAATSTSPAPAASAATAATPAGTPSAGTAGSPATAATSIPGKGKNRHGDRALPSVAPSAAPGSSVSSQAVPTPAAPAKGKNRHEGKAAATPAAGSSIAPEGAGAATPSPAVGKGKHGNKHDAKPVAPPDTSVPPGQSGAAPVAPEATQPSNKHKGEKARAAVTPAAEGAAQTPAGAPSEAPRGKHHALGRDATAVPTPPVVRPDAPVAPQDPQAGGQGRHRAERQLPPENPNPNPNAGAPAGVPPGEPHGHGGGGGGKHKQPGEPTPTPAP